MAKASWVRIESNEQKELRAMSRSMEYDPGYLVVPQSGIPAIFSSVLKGRCDSAVVMTSTGPYGTIIFVCNALRVDRNAAAIDHEPFGIALLSTGTAGSGVFLHHGSWDGRTRSDLPETFWQHVAASGVGNFFPTDHLPAVSTGPLRDLAGTSHGRAFQAVFQRLKQTGQVG